MNCQHCGAELTNKRAKNCAECAKILAEANHDNVYGFVTEAVATAKRDGLTGDAMRETMRLALRNGKATRGQWMDAYRAHLKQMRANRSNRIEIELEELEDAAGIGNTPARSRNDVENE